VSAYLLLQVGGKGKEELMTTSTECKDCLCVSIRIGCFVAVVVCIVLLVDDDKSVPRVVGEDTGVVRRDDLPVQTVMTVTYRAVTDVEDLLIVCFQRLGMCGAYVVEACVSEGRCMVVYELVRRTDRRSELVFEYPPDGCGGHVLAERRHASTLSEEGCLRVDRRVDGRLVDLVAAQWKAREDSERSW
jgi:hypothetical protein